MKIIIDNREPIELKTIIESRCSNVELRNLELGDIIFKDNDDNDIIIFERKSLNDLVSSIKDGRYSEQSFRLNQTQLSNHNIIYIIEGDLQKYSLKISEPVLKSIYSAMFSLSYVKGFSLFRTINIIETAELIVRFSEKIIKDKSIKSYYSAPIIPNNTIPNTSNFSDNLEVTDNSDVLSNNYSSTIRTSKKSNITKDNIGEIMLAQIPNVSITVAAHIMKEYINIDNLISNLKDNNTCLDNIKIPGKQGSRKINKNTVQNIKEFLLVS